MGCICGCHDKLDAIGVRGCCFECEKDHDPLRNALLQVRVLREFYDWYENAGSWSNVSLNPEDGCRWILKPDEALKGERLADAVDAAFTEKRNHEFCRHPFSLGQSCLLEKGHIGPCK